MDYKLLSKNIAEYLLRVFCFILVIKCFLFHLAGVFGLIVLPIIIVEMICKSDLTPLDVETTIPVAEFSTFDIYLIVFTTLYILAKIFGIFKKLDNINIIISFIIVAIISYLLVFICRMDILILNKGFYEIILEYNWIMYSLIPAFLLYKFFGFLTKKYPFPFKKIGYYTSIEFPKDLYSKIKGKIKNNS
jgi:hypothetical protein